MKKLLGLLIGLTFAGSLYAETCTTELRNRNHLVINTFDGWGYTMSEACNESRRQCHEELDWRLRSGSYPGAYCEDRYNRPTDPMPNQYRCFANLTRGNGNHLASFRGLSSYSQQQACTEALRDCQTDLRRRQSRGQNPRAYCEIDRGNNPRPGPGNPGSMTRTCNVELVNYNGRIDRVLRASVSGDSRDRNLQTVACERAMKQCIALRTSQQSCRVARY